MLPLPRCHASYRSRGVTHPWALRAARTRQLAQTASARERPEIPDIWRKVSATEGNRSWLAALRALRGPVCVFPRPLPGRSLAARQSPWFRLGRVGDRDRRGTGPAASLIAPTGLNGTARGSSQPLTRPLLRSRPRRSSCAGIAMRRHLSVRALQGRICCVAGPFPEETRPVEDDAGQPRSRKPIRPKSPLERG